MKLLFLLSIVVLSYQVNILTYDQAGEYILYPKEYEYKNNIIIHLYGAGSGSYKYSDYHQLKQAGGNSGAYLMMNINTVKNDTFYFTLGRGGNSSICSMSPSVQICYGLPGNYSLFYNDDKSILLNVSGGYGSSQYSGSMENATVTILNYRADDIVLKNVNGSLSNTIDSFLCHCNNDHGGPSPYGPNGGSYYQTPQCDGYMGSGAGYGCNYCLMDINRQYCIRPYKGGDGALVIYY